MRQNRKGIDIKVYHCRPFDDALLDNVVGVGVLGGGRVGGDGGLGRAVVLVEGRVAEPSEIGQLVSHALLHFLLDAEQENKEDLIRVFGSETNMNKV